MTGRDQITKAITEAEAALARLDQERAATAERLHNLRTRLADQGKVDTFPSSPNSINLSAITKSSSREEKLRLFSTLFHGRQDVFARFWQSQKTGKKGYSPVCEHEWQPSICTKPTTRCTSCKYLPLNDEVIYSHLEGRHIVGIYPLLQDETCYFLAIDFDKENWQKDAAAFLSVCESKNVPATLERSRSGNGGHVWIFFSEPVPATIARNMGSFLLTETMSQHHQLSMSSYDRLFPNQDTMPKGGFGNLIALPLQREARKLGNTEFLDDEFVPFTDQWAYLASVRRMSQDEVSRLAMEGANRNRIVGIALESATETDVPWRKQPTRKSLTLHPRLRPTCIHATIADQLYIEKDGVPSALLAEFKRLASFQNPKFYEAQRLRLSTFRIPRIISCAEDLPQLLAIPRGCGERIAEILKSLRIHLDITEERSDGDELQIKFCGDLTGEQQDAVDSLAQHEMGILVAPPGTGKTVVAIYLTAQRKRSTLILVHRKPLMEQWQRQLARFLSLDHDNIGLIGGGYKRRTGNIDIAMLQSLTRKGQVDPGIGNFGHIIIDECHHIPAFSFEQVMKCARARYVLGITATPYRRDGHDPIITMQCGPVRRQIETKRFAAVRVMNRSLIIKETGLHLPHELGLSFHQILQTLAANQARNQTIIDDVLAALTNGRTPLILTERRDHLKTLGAMLNNQVRNLIVLHGGKDAKQRDKIARQLNSTPDSENRVILATGSYVGEGFDEPRLDTLFLTMPVSFKGKLQQYVGRIMRERPDKQDVQIYDYVDIHVRMLKRMFAKRLSTYRAMGFKSENELIPGKYPLVKANSAQLSLNLTG